MEFRISPFQDFSLLSPYERHSLRDYIETYDGILSGLVTEKYRHYYPSIFIKWSSDEQNVNNFFVECTCDNYTQGNLCVHLAALVKIAHDNGLLDRNKDQAKAILEAKEKKKVDALVSIFNNVNSGDKRILTITPTLFFRLNHNKEVIAVDLSIGPLTGKSYKLNGKIHNFLESIDNNTFSFGKNFIYDPATDIFDSKSSRVIDILKMMSDLDSGSYYHERTFSNSGVTVPTIFVEELIDLFQLKEVSGYKIVKEHLDFNFNFSQSGNFIAIEETLLKNITVISDKFLKVKGDIKELRFSSKEQVSFIKKYNSRLSEFSKDNKILINKNSINLPNIISNFSEKGKVNLDSNLNNEVYIPKDVKSSVYVESYGKDAIKIKEVTLYDGKKIEDIPNILLLDKEGDESPLLESLKDFNSRKISKNEYLLEELEDIYLFMSEKVKDLAEKTEVFYEEAFKKRSYTSSRVVASGSIKDDILSFRFSVDGIEDKDLITLMDNLKEKKKFIRLRNGSIIKIDSEDFTELASIVENLNLSKEEIISGEVNRERQYAYFVRERLKNMSEGEIGGSLKRFANQLGDVFEVAIPAEFQMLRDYQRYGVSWLCFLKTYGLGGILADDMGLGKTLQTIAFLSITNVDSDKATLIIVPKSLMYNWKNEFLKFSPSTNVRILDGGKKNRDEILSTLMPRDIILASYGTMQKDIEAYKDIVFENVILDEAQNIKNIATKTTKAVKELKSKSKFALTGTPIENNLLELWSIFDFIMPGYLKTHGDFEKRFMKIPNHNLLKSLTTPFILRRMKKDVLTELPEKIESNVLVELLPEQKKIYLAYLKKAQSEIENSDENSMVMLSVLTRLRQICSHPGMFLEDYKGESAKVDLLLELLEEYKESGHRVLVFSQFTKVFQILKKKLENKFIYKYLDGATPAKERLKLVDEFNSGEGDVFLISLKAGGNGLNLTGADTVIHFDPWWNPAVEEQATDRAHRMGQKKVVNVLRFVTAGTIEESINKLKEEKRALVQEIFDGEGKDILKLDKKEILDLLKG